MCEGRGAKRSLTELFRGLNAWEGEAVDFALSHVLRVLNCIRGSLPLFNFLSSNFSDIYTFAVQIKPALEVNLQVIFFHSRRDTCA